MNRSLLTIAVAALSMNLVACHTTKRTEINQKATAAPATSGSSGAPLPGVGPGTGTTTNALTALTPDHGSQYGGTVVALTGSDFVTGMNVEFDGTRATDVVVTSPTAATCKAPGHAIGLVDVVVLLPNGATGRMNNAFTFDTSGPMARVADHGDPSGEEQELVELIQRARRNPTAEGQRLNATHPGANLDFSVYAASQPLSPNGFLSQAGAFHTNDMHTRLFYGHMSPDGVNANGRILATPYQLAASFGTDTNVNLTESIGKGTGSAPGNQLTTAQAVHDAFMVDAGLAVPKHRIIALSGGGKSYAGNREIGTSYLHTTESGLRADYVDEEFAFSKTDRAFVLGVAYDDKNGDKLAQNGEGRKGVTVTLSHSSGFSVTTTTQTAGGFSFEVFVDGTYTLTIDGKAQTVVVAKDNVKVDLRNNAIELNQ